MYQDKRAINLTFLLVALSVILRLTFNIILNVFLPDNYQQRQIIFEIVDVLFFLVNFFAGCVAVLLKKFPSILFFSFNEKLSVIAGGLYTLTALLLYLLHFARLLILLRR